MRSDPHRRFSIAATAALVGQGLAASVDLNWYAPSSSLINNIENVVSGSGIYGFVYNNSYPTDVEYGTYNWCNMPHVRKQEYKKASDEYNLKYVELIHRHHKRTVYASNAFPVESYGWNCDDMGLYYYGQPAAGNKSAHSYWSLQNGGINPFKPSGFIGSCAFPQITAQGLDDSWQHGKDLYGVYHDLLHFIPDSPSNKVAFRVTQNVITSQVAGMLINGMFGSQTNVPLNVQASGVDSLEPSYSCSKSSSLYNSIKSSSAWNAHLSAASPLYAVLDDISGVSPSDSGFHASFDHYYDNLSARQCHAKPLPCKLVNGANSTSCITQSNAEAVYRMGHWEYSYIYRDSPDSLRAAAASYGVWVAELAANIRGIIAGTSDVIYRHNVAHDGSISRLLSFLQIDSMIWPGMGSEIVFEVYKKEGKATPTTLSKAIKPTAASCNTDSCLRQLKASSTKAAAFCATYTVTPTNNSKEKAEQKEIPNWLGKCGKSEKSVSSACACFAPTTTSAVPAATSSAAADMSSSGHYVRVLFGGKILKSSNPMLGLLNMVPLETLLAYIDGLAGENASLVKANCAA